ncbi:unnamed protein product [Meloidogyne enterolobii]|uniref:Uncharacterized protein n=1 Tax=Meloidogyne enterolobii TaxID=390850 RepID=A0ACB1AKN1_MELEN
MAYATKYYDYQVAIIFLILLAGMALLALVVGAIYFICVVNVSFVLCWKKFSFSYSEFFLFTSS